MLIFGTLQCLGESIERYTENIMVFNISTFCEQYPNLFTLNPLTYYPHLDLSNPIGFDQWYHNFIVSNPDAYRVFIDLMRLIYNGYIVYILIDPNIEVSNIIVDAIRKMVLDRYGASSNIVYCIEDFDNLKEPNFSMQGLSLFDKELEYYIANFGYRNLPSDIE